MTKRIAFALAVVAALFALTTAPAAAQDGPSITVEPATVEAAGEQEFTISGSGWTASALFVLQCIVVEDATQLDATGGDCDLGNLVPATPDGDGNWEVTATFNVAEDGITIIAGDNPPTESALQVVTVGAAAQEEGGEEEAAEEEEAAAEEEGGEEELANTGVESGLIAIMAAALLAGGLMVLGTARRRTA